MDNSHCIKYHQTNSFSKLFLDYVDGAKELAEFYEFAPRLDSIPNAIQQKSSENINRDLLVERLALQYSEIKISEKVKENLNLLKEKKTFSITTGHQLAIYTGEWYFIFKIITAINMAKEAKELYPEYNFVPVFWMASEDHDFEEINHIHLKNEKFEWKENVKGPAGRLKVDALEKMNDSLAHFLKGKTHAEELISIFKKSYQKGFTLAKATRILVNELFADEGLVIIDADDVELKRSWTDTIAKELAGTANYEACIHQSKKLEALNYPTQIHPREINLFYLLDGYRERLIKEKDNYKTADGLYNFNTSEIKNELTKNPERFSPNVVLRPVYQESILPNICYIGGPGEIAYWLQLKTVFENNKVMFPIVAWRNSFMMMDKKDYKTWQGLNFKNEDFFKSQLDLENEYVLKHTREKINLNEEEKLLNVFIEEIKNKAMQVDENLQYTLIATEKRISKMMERITHKMWKAEKKKHKLDLARIEKIKSNYFPHGKLQERYENFSFWYANCGKAGIEILKDNTKVLQKDFCIEVM